MDWIPIVAERKIQEAIEAGEFDDLPDNGRPIDLEEDMSLTPHQRITARILRASVLVVRELDYVHAARVAGASHWHILLRHILPNSMAPLIVQLSFVFAYAVLSEAVLSFLGLGAPPTQPSWGILIAEGRGYIREAWWLTFMPGAAIAVTVLGVNLLGDGLRDVLDPRLKIEQG